MPKIWYGYLIQKIRLKISYEACRTSRTVLELFNYSILKTYEQRMGLMSNPMIVNRKKFEQFLENFYVTNRQCVMTDKVLKPIFKSETCELQHKHNALKKQEVINEIEFNVKRKQLFKFKLLRNLKLLKGVLYLLANL